MIGLKDRTLRQLNFYSPWICINPYLRLQQTPSDYILRLGSVDLRRLGEAVSDKLLKRLLFQGL